MYRRQDAKSGMVARQKTTSFIQLQSARKSIPDGKEVGRNGLLVAIKNLSCCAKHYFSWSQTHFPHLNSPFSHHPLHQETDSISHTLYFVPSHPNRQHATSINVFKDPKRGRTSRPRDQLMQIWCNDCLPLSPLLSTGLGSTDYWRDDKYRYETSSVRYGVV